MSDQAESVRLTDELGVLPPLPHRGLRADRLLTDRRGLERAFAEQWAEENRELYYRNGGYGILDLMVTESTLEQKGLQMWVEKQTTILDIDDTHRTVAATVIQWLGTNVGMCFLREALRKAGYKLVPVENT